MSEKNYVSVDSNGTAEFHESERQETRRQGPVFSVGDAIVPTTDLLTVDQIGEHRYFGEPGGRIIDTRTGETVMPGDGSNKVHISEIADRIRDHEEAK